MTTTTHVLSDLEARARAGEPMTLADAERVATCADLISVGMLGEALRKAWRGDRVTFCRVADVRGEVPEAFGEAGEVRLAGPVASPDEARSRVRTAVARAGGVPVTGYTADELLAMAGGDLAALTDLAAALRADGLESVAEVPLDRIGDADRALALVRAVIAGGLGAWRATVDRATAAAGRVGLLERAARIQADTGAFRSIAPLARTEARDAPSTGYDDVRTIAAARLLCHAIPAVQVDWHLYGPKLAQVAIAYGADDLDAVPAHDVLQLGHRRSPREDLERQIRAAFAEPVERNGRHEAR